jgi:hypothetical protein
MTWFTPNTHNRHGPPPALRFDRGIIANTLEFWGVPGFAVDYTQVFELPTPTTKRSKYTLTQENIMRYSNSSQAQLLPTGAGAAYRAPEKADPTYGGDLEMGSMSSSAPPPPGQFTGRSDRGTSMTTYNRQFSGTQWCVAVRGNVCDL